MKIILTRAEADHYLKEYFADYGIPPIESIDIIDLAPAAKPSIEVDPDFIQFPNSTLPC